MFSEGKKNSQNIFYEKQLFSGFLAFGKWPTLPHGSVRVREIIFLHESCGWCLNLFSGFGRENVFAALVLSIEYIPQDQKRKPNIELKSFYAIEIKAVHVRVLVLEKNAYTLGRLIIRVGRASFTLVSAIFV